MTATIDTDEATAVPPRRASDAAQRARLAAIESEEVGFTHLAAYNGRPSTRKIIGLLLLTVVLAGVCAQAAYGLESLRPDVWQARTQVEYRGNSWLETQDVSVQSNSLKAPIAERYGVPIKDFNERLEAGQVPGTQTIQIDYFDRDADLALAIVTDLQAAYLAEVTERTASETMTILEEELADLEDELATAQDELSRMTNPNGVGLSVEQQDKQSEIGTLRVRITEVERTILDVELDELNNTRVPRVTAEPFVFDEPFTPRPGRMAIVGFVLGTLIGLSILVWNWWTAAVREAY